MKVGIITILAILILTCRIVNGQLTIKDQEATPNTLLRVNDEGTAGSIYLPHLSTHPGDLDQKLYNYAGKLFWNGNELGSAYSAGGWTNLSGNIYTTTLTDKVGIGTSNPKSHLHIKGQDYSSLRFASNGIWEWTITADDNTFDLVRYTPGWSVLMLSISTATGDFSIPTSRLGIGTITPSASLHVAGYDGALFEGTYAIGTLPKEGSGTRMMWYPKKAAFRAGRVDGVQWDDANIGDYSFAVGNGTYASGESSIAMGFGTKAIAQYTTAMGDRSEANGDFSTAMGFYSIANGDYSTSMGMTTEANGISSTAMGSYTKANGNYSTAIGYGTKANSNHSVAIGVYNVGGGSASGWIETDPLFEIGNSINETQPANAMTVLKNGNVGIGTVTPAYKLDISEGNLLVRGDDGFTANGHEGIVHLGSVHSYIKSEYGYGVKIGAYAAPDAISIKQASGDVGIGTTNPQGKLDVNGAIYQRGSTLHADYVFEDDYELESIEEHSEFMWENKHLKAIPKATVDENGIEYVEVGSHRKGIVEELEKAHIYISQLEESIKLLTKRIEKLEIKN